MLIVGSPVLPQTSLVGSKVQFQHVGRRDLEDPLEQRVWAWDVRVGKVVRERLIVEFSRVNSRYEQRFELRPENKARTGMMVVEGLNAEMVSRQYQLPSRPVVDRDRKNTVQ